MKIKMLKNCLVGGQHFERGDEVDVSDRDGIYLVNSKAAELVGKPGKAKRTTVKRTSIVLARACMVGGVHVEAGEEISALDADAAYLLQRGQAFEPGSDQAKDFIKRAAAVAKAAEKAAAEKAAAEKAAAEKAAAEKAAAEKAAAEKAAAEKAAAEKAAAEKAAAEKAGNA